MLFSDLSPSAKIVYHVTRRIKNHKTNSFFHSTNKIAKIAGISERACRYALDDLVKNKILSKTDRTGHTNLYTFINVARLSEDNPRTICSTPLHDLHPTPANSAPITTSALTSRALTTTWLDDQLRDKLIRSHGEQAVNDRVVVIASLNGKIRNKAGLLVDSLKRGYIPESKELREKEERQRKDELRQARYEAERLEREKMLKDFSENPSGQIDLVAMLEESFKEKQKND